MKTCFSCKLLKSSSEFYKWVYSSDGLSSYCKECKRTIARNERIRNKEAYALRLISYNTRNPGRLRMLTNRAASKRYRLLRLEIIKQYGGRCLCCGESKEAFLSIDHIFNDGAQHRKVIGKNNLYRELKRLGFPKDRYQILCFNCNCAKGFFGVCPHETVRQCHTVSFPVPLSATA